MRSLVVLCVVGLCASMASAQIVADVTGAHHASFSAMLQNDGDVGLRGPWTPFQWSAPGQVVNIGNVDFSTEHYLDVTDAFIVGDQFEIFIDDVSVGETSIPIDDGSSAGGDYDAAFLNPLVSSGTFGAFTGIHNVKIQIIDTATGFPAGGAAWRTNAVPEPTSLVCLALGGLALLRKR